MFPYNFSKGISTYNGEKGAGKGTWPDKCKEEQIASAMENQMRSYFNLPQREFYTIWDVPIFVPIFNSNTGKWYLHPGSFPDGRGYKRSPNSVPSIEWLP